MSVNSIIIVILMLSIFDGIMSWLGVQSGINEGNPIALGLYNIVCIDGKLMVMPGGEGEK